jgi:hypothetical protein
VKNNPDKPWDWDWLSKNPNITFDIVKDNPDKPWNQTITNTRFLVDDCNLAITCQKCNNVKTIKNILVKTKYDPMFKTCLKRMICLFQF